LFAVMAVFGLVLLPGVSLPAGAQTPDEECDPAYGCDPEEPTAVGPVSCSTGATVVAPGETVEVDVTGAPEGSQVDATYDGTVVASGVADSNGSAKLSFTVPPTSGPGSHSLFVQGAGFSSSCGTVEGANVQGVQVTQPGASVAGSGSVSAGSGSGGGSGGGGSLARTGLEVAFWLAIGLVLIVVGSRLVSMARRRRRRALRSLNDVRTLEHRHQQDRVR
jgi:hypothetical protein